MNYKLRIANYEFRPTRKLVLSLFFVLYSVLSFSQVSSSIDSTSIKIGEELKYIIQVEADTTDLVIFPEGQLFLPLEVIESYKIDTTFEAAKYKLIKKYGLTQFDSGKYTIPQQRIIINEKAFLTDSLKVEVNDVVVDTLKQKMFDIKEKIGVDKPKFDGWIYVFSIIGFLFVLGAVVFLLLRRKKRKEEAERKVPPYEEAISALKKLDNSNIELKENPKVYYSTLTEIVKRYLDREVDEGALERTSNELIDRLFMHKDAGSFEFDKQTILNLDSILKRADLVKFAKMKQTSGQIESDRRDIEEIINETKEIIPEPTEEELLQTKAYQEALQKKRQRKKLIIGGSSFIGLLLVAGIVYGAIYGFDNLKDNIFGNPTKNLFEAHWIKSEYGNPSVTIETPDVLIRNEAPKTDALNSMIQETEIFTVGSMTDILFVRVRTINFTNQQQINLDNELEKILSDFEKQGAKNMVVKTKTFETEKGIKGVSAEGTFKLELSEGKEKSETSHYKLLLFAQNNGLQEVLVVYEDDERFAQDIKKRIINSVELEVNKK